MRYLLVVAIFCVAAITSQEIQCPPCKCYNENYKITVICQAVDVKKLEWDLIPPVEINAIVKNSTMAFHYLPANLRNLTTEMTIEDADLEDMELLGYYALKGLSLNRVNAPDNKAHFDTSALAHIQSLRITDSNLREFSFTLENYVRVDLSGNKLIRIPIVKNVDHYNLRNNSLLSVSPAETECSPMTRLTHLDLSYNKIANLPESAFKCVFETYGMSELHLNISYNNIRSIHENAFLGLQIRQIDLSHNNLRTIGVGALAWMQVKRLDLEYNPWQCDCSAQWMLDELLPYLYNTTPALLYDFRCDTPKGHRGRSLAYWYNRSNEVFCGDTPSALSFSYAPGKVYELWTGQVIVCIILLVVIVLLLATILAVWLWPKRAKNQRQQIMRPNRPRPLSSNPRYSHVGLMDDKF